LGDVEKLLSMLDGIRVGLSHSDSAPKPVSETETPTIKLDGANADEATIVIKPDEPTTPLETETDSNVGNTEPIPGGKIPYRPDLRSKAKDSTWIEFLKIVGLYLGDKPAQRTLWYWTYIPIGVFVMSWLSFFINGSLDNHKPEDTSQKVTALPIVAPKPDTVLAAPAVPTPPAQKPVDIDYNKKLIQLEEDRLKLEKDRLKLEQERKDMATKRLADERRAEQLAKQEASDAANPPLAQPQPAHLVPLPKDYKPTPGTDSLKQHN
jgi:hypothetical protein